MSFIACMPDHPFPLQNIPYGVFSTAADPTPRPCTAIGDYIVDLRALARVLSPFPPAVAAAFEQPTLNAFMALGYDAWVATRAILTDLLSSGTATLRDNAAARAQVIVPSADAAMHLPAAIGDYTDFYASREHATNVGKMFRPGQPPLLENYLHLPVGYHGRASSIVVSGTPLRRPMGQMRPDPNAPPVQGPCRAMDFELEMAAFVGPGNALGTPIPVAEAPRHIFGFALFNDWSARDVQKWEYVPLGPFLGKSFCSTVGPWIVSSLALDPFRVQGPAQADPTPLPYLQQGDAANNYDIALAVTIGAGADATVVSNTNFRYMYWSAAQMIAHHTINGCNLRPGDVLASGTVSGPTARSYGSMLELSWQGTQPVKLKDGSERKMLLDGDTVTLSAECVGDGYRIGFGPCSGTVMPATPPLNP